MLAEQSQKWFPTHVQVTVLQARRLCPKGKGGSNDAYTIIQLGREKYSTSVAEKSLSPTWKEEMSFELPGLLLQGTPERYTLGLVVLHRSLVGLDKFLGQVAICLNELFENKSRRQKEWFKLESKPGKKSKERGELQVSIQFMRNNMTASMFDLSMKDKTRSPFAKFKDKMKGRKNDSTISDHSSAIVPSTASNSDQDALEVDKQQKSKPKKTFLLGPQRLSSAQSMSDLTGPRQSLEKMKSNTVGHVVCKSHSDSANSNEEMGLVYMSQKAATLPRSKNPFENSSDSWKTRGDASSETPNDGQSETKKEAKKDKEKEKMSLFARVTGKKDAKKSEKVIARSDGFGDPLNPFTKDLQASFEFDSRNPFSANYNAVANSSSLKSPMTDDLKIVETSSHDKLNYQKINQHLSKGFKQHHFEYHGDKSRVNDPNLFATGYRNLSNNELICELLKHKELIKRKDGQIRELEDYIDNLLVRVMEETPSILRVPYEPSRRAGKLPKKN
ncbi:rab11 family-interacting protein 2 [Callorhinchus milii]|nr:rab11 family-interacting protein 2 [Callorhinchus milii]